VQNSPIELPAVDEVQGLWFNGEWADLQFLSGGVLYNLKLPLDQILKSEDWFISLRRSLAPVLAARKAALLTR
jgi:hypothetical protein